MEKVRLKRKRLKVLPKGRKGVAIEPPIPVLLTAFGSNIGRVLVGQAVRKTKTFVTVELKDEEGAWTEDYSLNTGVRIGDAEEKDGWKMNPTDLENHSLEKEGRLTNLGAGVECLFRERIPISEGVDGKQEAVYEVWHNKNNGALFLKGCTEVTDIKGRTKQHTRLIPFVFLKKALADFCVDWG